MKLMQSFLMFFYILDQCYDRCQESDLGGFLGLISPELWEDGTPINRAVYNDWKDRNHVESLDDQNIVNAVISFLDYYQKNFGYAFSKTKKLLKSMTNGEIVEKAAARTSMMYQRYHYSD